MIVNVLVVVGIFALDQFTKWLSVLHVMPVETIPLIDGVFHLTYAENTGAAFSILQNQRLFFIIATLILIAVMVYLLVHQGRAVHPLFRISLLFVIGGALGNFWDRLINGFVVDMLDFRLIQFAIFNVADCFVVVGTILLCAYILLFDKKQV